MDCDLFVVGAGPAGLTAATQVASAGRHVMLAYLDTLGGQLPNMEWVENYPAPGERIEGYALASSLAAAAEAAGVEMLQDRVTAIEHYSSCHAVSLASGRTITARTLLLACGLDGKALGLPGEDGYKDRGLIHCALCDAAFYRDQAVAVCGGGDAGAIDALYLARFASKVYLVEREAALTAREDLRARVAAEPRIEVLTQAQATALKGEAGIEAITIDHPAGGQARELAVQGVMVRVGFLPATGFLDGSLAVAADGRLVVADDMQTGKRGVLAAGDVRADGRRTVLDAVADGAAAAKAVLARLG